LGDETPPGFAEAGRMVNGTDIVEVPYTSLHADTLRAVVEEFITRAGTDYGARERTLDEKIADVMRHLQRGEAMVVFDRRTATVNIVVTRQPR
jgi:uncharacterized protein YheU (UPF0270 family)